MKRIDQSRREFLHGVQTKALGYSITDPRGVAPTMTAAPTASTSAGTMAPSSVVVRTPGAPTDGGIGGARSPADIGAAILAKEVSMVGVATSDKPCVDLWSVLLFDIPCDQSLSLVYLTEYLEAQRGIAALATFPEPSSPTDRATYVGAVGAYAWVMSWASGLEGAALPYSGGAFAWNEGSPGFVAFSQSVNTRSGGTVRMRILQELPGLGLARSAGSHPDGTGDLPITISQLNSNRCNPGVWTGAIDDTGRRAPVVGLADFWGTAEGAGRVASARLVAQQLASYSMIQMWVDAFAEYGRLLDQWKAAGMPVDLPASKVAQAGLAVQAAHTWSDVNTAAATASAAGGATGLPGTLATIAGAILSVFSMLPAASGGVSCPRPFLYRSSTHNECSGSSESAGGAGHVFAAQSPVVASLVQAQRESAASRERKSIAKPSTLPVGWIVGGILGAALLGLAAFRKKR